MVPQGQLAYYPPTPSAPAPPMYQAPAVQFSQPSHIPHMASPSPASSSEPSMYGHPPNPAPYAGTPVSVAPSGIYPSSTHHTNFAHNAGSEHELSSTSFSNGVTFTCQWQGQDYPPSSSPPPPAYPPGFEPRQNDGATRCISSSVATGNPCIPTSHAHAQPHPHPHPHPHLPPSNALPEQHLLPPPYLQPCPPSHLHQHPSSQTPMLLPTVQTAHLPMAHGFDTNGTVIGVPVMGTPIYGDATCPAPAPVTPHGQQPFKSLQPKYGRRPMSSDARQQSCKSTFHLTRYFRGNSLHEEISSKGARNVKQYAWQPSNAQGRATSRFRDCSQRQVASTVDNLSKDCSSNMRSNHQLQVPPCELNSGTNGRQPPNHFRENQPQATERFHSKTCPPKGITLPKAQDVYISGHQKLVSSQSNEHKENLHCEAMADRPDEQPLRFNVSQQSSLASACSEAQSSSHIKCEEIACSPNVSGELVKEHQMGSATRLGDSEAASLSCVKKREGLNRWLQERKNKYPTPANILRKVEERRKWEEMGECASEKPKTRLQHIRGVFTKCYQRRERPRIEERIKVQEQNIDDSRLATRDSRDEEADSCHSANGSEIPQDTSFQGEVSDSGKGIRDTDSQSILTSDEIAEHSGKGIRDTDSQSILTSDEIAEQNNIEKTPGPGNVFLFRQKRQKRNCDQSTSGAVWQKQLLFKILDRDIEKESSYLLQCCRFIVNNHFLQGISPLNVKHFRWVRAGKPSSVSRLSADGMHDSPACAMQAEMSTLGAMDILTEKVTMDTQALANDEGPEPAHVREDNCKDFNEPSLTSVENAYDDNLLGKNLQHASALPSQELSCSNTKQELTEDSQEAPSLQLQEMSFINKEQNLIEDGYTNSGSQNRYINGSHHGKEAPYPWKHSDGYIYQKTTASGLPARHYDCFREPFCAYGLITDFKHAPLLHSSSNLDAQGLAPLLWEHPNADSHLPNREMDTGELGSGVDDSMLNDDDDILQYMNFDAFETDSGICYV